MDAIPAARGNSQGPEDSTGPLQVSFLCVSKGRPSTHFMEAAGEAHRGCGWDDPKVSLRRVSLGVVCKAGVVRLMESRFMENPPPGAATGPGAGPRLYLKLP